MGFQFIINGYGISAIGVFALQVDGDPNSPTANVVKNTNVTYGSCKFIVVKEDSLYTFSIYVTGTFSSGCVGYMAAIPTDNLTSINLSNNVDVTSLTAYSTVEL